MKARGVSLLAGAAITLTALNLRPAVTSIGAVLREVQDATGMSSTLAGVLTTLPPICFGVFGLLGAWLGRRLGTVPLAVATMAVTALSLAARVATDRPVAILLLTVPALAGLALGNVLLPVAVHRWFPRQIGRATGLYSLAMAVGSALAAAGTVPVVQAAGSWRAGLGIWALPPIAAVLAWLWLGRADTSHARDEPAPAPPRLGAVHRHPRAWALAGFFGLQSLGAYVVFGWLPTIYRDAGLSPSTAGLLLAFVILLGAPISVVLPELAARREDQRGLVVLLGLAAAAAYVGLLAAPARAPWVWAGLLGLGMGAFPLALVLIGLRARTAAGTSALSSLSQGVGYLIAAGGPFAMGALHDATGGWTAPLLVLTGLLLPQLWCGLIAAKPGHIDEGPVPDPQDREGTDRSLPGQEVAG